MSPLCRQLAEVVRERYLSGPEKAMRHGILADFFLGAWSQGTKKLITLPLVGKPLNLDRKVRCLHPCSPPPSTSTRLCGQDQVTIHTFPSSLSSFMPRSWASLADVLPPRFFVLFCFCLSNTSRHSLNASSYRKPSRFFFLLHYLVFTLCFLHSEAELIRF